MEDTGTRLTVVVDQSVCVGGGQCNFLAPEVFTQRDEDGVVELLDEHPPAEMAEVIEEAIAVCPSRAISLKRQ